MTQDQRRNEILQRLRQVFQDVFDDDQLLVSEETSAADIESWDSLMHVTLCVAVEREFKTRLNTAEIARFANIGGLIDLLEKK